MTDRFKTWLPSISLLVLALMSGVLWRVELEMRSGWASLAWIAYFHGAIPFAVGALILWVVCFSGVERPLHLAVVLATTAAGLYPPVQFAAEVYFAEGPSGVLALMIVQGPENLWILDWGLPILWSLLPLVFCAICWGFGVRIKVGAALLSAVLFTASWPLAILVRGFFETRGSPDLIHALKSGFVIPFLVLSLGLPILLRGNFPHSPRPREAV